MDTYASGVSAPRPMMIQSCIMTTSQATVTEEARRMEGRMKMELDGRRRWLLISINTGRLLVPSGLFLTLLTA